ncbi:MAG: efflux RND transporter periplasmic adaptor subunit [Rhodospirillales bacterium]|nr:efflux RND transporter periplasmic adaptor subunit [Rhodospirillales bacterium]
MQKALAGIAFLAVIVGGGYYYWQHEASRAGVSPPGQVQEQPENPVRVEAAKVAVGPMTREVSAIGTLKSDESVIIRPEIMGRIAEIGFREGQSVNKGQVLVRLDASSYQAQLRRAEANLALSEANSRRARMLFAQGAGTERARDESAAKLRTDAAEVELARAMLEKTTIVAPFDGIVGLRKVSIGAFVSPGQDIANLENIDPIKADFRIPELYLGAVGVGQTVTVTSDAFPNRDFRGEVYAIDPLIDEAGRSILLRALMPNADRVLRPGQFVRISLVIEENANALTVPEEALVPQGSEVMVFKVVDGKAVPTNVEIGSRRGGRVEVKAGLAADDVVVTAGQMKLRAGMAVAVVDAKRGA